MATEKQKEPIALHRTVELTRNPENAGQRRLAEQLMVTVENEKRNDVELLRLMNEIAVTSDDNGKDQIKVVAEQLWGEDFVDLQNGEEEKDWLKEVVESGKVEPGDNYKPGYQKLTEVFNLDPGNDVDIVEAARLINNFTENVAPTGVNDEGAKESQKRLEDARLEYARKQGETGIVATVGVAGEDFDIELEKVIDESEAGGGGEPEKPEIVEGEVVEVHDAKKVEAPTEKERDWEGEYEALRDFGPDVLGRWVGDNIRDLPPEIRDRVKADMAAVVRPTPAPAESMFRTKEIEMTDERTAQARKIIIDLIEGTDGLGVESGLSALEARIAKLAEEWGGFVSEEIMDGFRKELKARINLKQSNDFWSQVTEYSDKDQMRVGLKERISTAPIVTKETYKWIVESGELLVMEDGRLEKENLREEVDHALALIWEKMMNEDIKYRDPRGVLGVYQSYYGPLSDGEPERDYEPVHRDAFLLAWRLAEAEMWIAEKAGKPTLHPAVRVINFAGIRWSKRDLGGSATYGGRRLYFQHKARGGSEDIPESNRGRSVFELSNEELARNPYQREGRGFAGTGLFFVGNDRLETRRAVREGRYLQFLSEQWEREGLFSPQERAMKSLNECGIKVFETMKELVGGEAKYVSADKVGGLIPWLFIVDEKVWANAGESSKDEAVNRMFIEASKTLIWGASLANEDNLVDPTGIMKMLPLGELNKILYGLVAAVDPRDRNSGMYIGRRKVDMETDRGVSSRNLNANKREVREMVEWYGREVVGRLRSEVFTKNPFKAIGDALGLGADKFKYLRDRGQLDQFMVGDLDYKPRQYYLARGLGVFGI